ncbi:potassium channel family protein [Halomonas binhaiensis]|uniref:Two pore domain potassium channel family protein n=1 Tax=Halomonas binhaiensis TaxID=2562282 RepID=A0A5C1NG64_9GAMM|nr:potassium channel family protein [Halomonas binhaiensis]QEM82682.1 two pore domain potassium channel family protein [Halomonas binhaiensis]
MLMNLLIGLSTMAVCLLLQTLLLTIAIRYYTRHREQVSGPSAWKTLKILNIVMTILVLGNLTQVTLWALVFRMLGEFEIFSTAVYHSAVNFATLGYGDIVMSEQHRLLGPLEAINGVLMIGVSTAALMATVQDMVKRTILARQQDDHR